MGSSSTMGCPNFAVSGPHWKKKSCLGPHIQYTNTNENRWAKKKVLSKFMILCWATFIAILGCMWPTGCRLDTSLSGFFPSHLHLWDSFIVFCRLMVSSFSLLYNIPACKYTAMYPSNYCWTFVLFPVFSCHRLCWVMWYVCVQL